MDIERFKIVVVPLREKLQNFARSILIDSHEAEDSVQEVFLRLWNVREQLGNHPNVEGFAMQTTKHICIDKIRARKFNQSLDDIPLAIDVKNPHTYAEEIDTISIIQRIIATLPESQQIVLKMRDVEGYEFSEIADVTGMAEETIRVTLSRARKKVRDVYFTINNQVLQKQ